MPGRKMIESRTAKIVSGLIFALYYGWVLGPLAANAAVKDHDGMPQRWERKHGTNPRVHDAGLDVDSDKLTNIGEFRHHTEPLVADTDGDGLLDGEEVKELHTDPKKADSDGDGLNDGDENEGESDTEECEDDDAGEAEDADEAGDEDANDDEEEGEEDDDAEEEDDGEDEAEDADEAGDVDANDDAECEDDGEDDSEDEGEIEHVVAEILSYNSSTGRLELKTTEGKTVTGTVTDDTELDWESLDGSEPDESASEDDLDAGQDVTDYEFESGSSNFSEVDLAR
jgi:thrombospondin type 3 repeat protein